MARNAELERQAALDDGNRPQVTAMNWPTSAQGAKLRTAQRTLEDVSDVLASVAVAASWDPRRGSPSEAGRTTDSLRNWSSGALLRALQLPQAG